MFDDLFARNGLSFDRLHALVRLSESGSLIQAAKGDAGEQSRLSHRLRELSSYFGTELTMKNGRTLKLSEAGEALAQLAREQFRGLQAFRDRAAQVQPSFHIAAGDNLMQSLVVPALGMLRRSSNPVRVTLINLRTREIVWQLKERRVEFGVMRLDAAEEPLEHVKVCKQTYAVFVPQRLVPARGMVSIRDALLSCPHAALGGEGQLMERLRELANGFGGSFEPELACDSVGQCIAAVRTGTFAAVLPAEVQFNSTQTEYVVVEDDALDALSRDIVLAWHPRTLQVMGSGAERMRRVLAETLRRSREL
jgi:DNA-binding transcriptional LysR family regulator